MAVQIIREGWLRKEGGKRHNWKRRWFTLGDTNQLTYYESPDKKHHKGTIDLTKAKLLASHKKQKHGFGIICPKRTWYLAAVDNTEREVWLSTLGELLPRTSTLRLPSRSLQDSSSNSSIYEEVTVVPAGSGLVSSGSGYALSAQALAQPGPGFAPSGPALPPPGPGYNSSEQAPLPYGWEKLRNSDGRFFYANHITKTTQWHRPVAEPSVVEYKAPPDVAAAPPPPAIVQKPKKKFKPRIDVGQKVKILKRYKDIPSQSIGQVTRVKPDNSVVVFFGTETDVCFMEHEIWDWLEPWGPAPDSKVVPSFGKQPLVISFNEGRLGLEFKLRRVTFIVTKVVRNYEAWKKGVLVGMQMVSAVDGYGKSVQGSSAVELAQNLTKAPRPVKITFISEQLASQPGVYI